MERCDVAIIGTGGGTLAWALAPTGKKIRYVVDASLFPSSAAVNPALTIMANALRVGDHLKNRLR